MKLENFIYFFFNENNLTNLCVKMNVQKYSENKRKLFKILKEESREKKPL